MWLWVHSSTKLDTAMDTALLFMNWHETSTRGRWLFDYLIKDDDDDGDDTKQFGPHSASSAPDFSLKEILSMGHWRQASEFCRYYEATVSY